MAAGRLRERLTTFAAGQREQPPPLPLVAFYGTGRLWSEHRLTQGKRSADPSALGRLAGYLDSLSSSSSFKAFADWYERTAKAARSATAVAYGPNERPEKLLAAVREATRTVLEPTRWRDIDWEFPPNDEHGQPKGKGYLVVEHPDHGRLPLSQLSDGVRNMIALVADLAHRCVRLNPHFGAAAAELTPGILLIDEIDMHLHPRWQQLVVELLQRAFPAMQMVVSTHSPHVLSTVDVSSIRVIRLQNGSGVLDTPKFQTKGVESADVLAAIMGVDPVPQVEEAKVLSSYRALIEDGAADTSEGRRLRAEIVDHFGHDHPLVAECDRLIRFQAFKRNASRLQER
jgi:predicted ATP-binding protein involved in virulence